MNVYECQLCTFTSKWVFACKEHVKVHNIEPNCKDFNCMILLKNFTCLCKKFKGKVWADLQYHYKNTHNRHTIRGVFECPETDCSYKEYEWRPFKAHILNVHISVKKTLWLKCDHPNCGYKTEFKRRFNLHLLRNHKNRKCPHNCDYIANSSSRLKQHIKLQHYRKCLMCTFATMNMKDLNNHLAREHNFEYILYACTACRFYAQCQGKLMQHINKYHILSNRYCPYCPHFFKCNDEYIHYGQHIKLNDKLKQICCPFCDFQTNWKIALYSHLSKRHSEIRNNEFKCPQCDDHVALSKIELDDHLISEHVLKSCICLQCTLSQSEVPVKNVPAINEKYFECVKCEYNTLNNASFNNHLKHHSTFDDNENRTTSTEVCDNKSIEIDTTKNNETSTSLYKYYTKKGMVKKWFKCLKCKYCTLRKQDLKKHEAANHISDNQFLLCCFCKRKFSTTFDLINHVLKMNGSENIFHKRKMEIPIYECGHCSYKDANEIDLIKHLMSHRELPGSIFNSLTE